MRILITTVQVPFIRGGAEILADELLKALEISGHEVEMIKIPFGITRPEQVIDCMLACRLLDISDVSGQGVDKIIALKFPAYLINHSNKVLWLLHQYRQAYDLWGHEHCGIDRHPLGLSIRESIINADNKIFSEYQNRFTIAGNVTKRLKKFNNFESTPLYHPPQDAELFYCDKEEGYFFFPSRINPMKRQNLVVQALAETRNDVKVIFAGKSEMNFEQHLTETADKLGVLDRIKFLGAISQEEKIRYSSKAIGVIYPPYDEDYGYVTLEGMLAAKPVITCTDSGGPLEFIRHQETGLIAEPNPVTVALAMDMLWENRSWAANLGKAAKDYYDSLNITWSKVIEKLLA